MRILTIFQILLSSLWTGGAIITGYLVVPVIFNTLKPKTDLAGTLAGNIFVVMSWVGLAIGSLLLICFLLQSGIRILAKRRTILVLTSMILIAINHFLIHPRVIAARVLRAGGDNDAATTFAWLHGSASLLFLLVTILGVWLLLHLIQDPLTEEKSRHSTD